VIRPLAGRFEQTLIGMGAVDVVVPGVLPIGCFPTYLTLYGTSNAADYDRDGCLRSYNDLSYYHNALLKRSLASLCKGIDPKQG